MKALSPLLCFRRVYPACALVLLSIPLIVQAEPVDATAYVSVHGEAEVAVVPDLAEVVLSVVTQADSAVKAVTENSGVMRSLQAQIKTDFELAETDLQTSQFNVAPRYSFENQRQRLLGYEVQHSLTIRLTSLDRLGQLLDAVVQAGANQIQGVSYATSRSAELADEARRAAFADAKRRATIYAELAERELGCVLAVSENTTQAMPVMARSLAVADVAASVPIASGQVRVQAGVDVRFALGADAAGC